MSIVGNMAGCYSPMGKTFVITDENGNEITGVVVDQEQIFTATDNDVREGMVYASDAGVSTGSKNIPAYHTNAGKRLILPNSNFVIPLSEDNAYDYTALQCIISLADPDNFDNSVNTDRIVLNHSVFQVNSSVKLADVIKDSDALSIDLNITNDSDNYYFIHYFTYKEEY